MTLITYNSDLTNFAACIAEEAYAARKTALETSGEIVAVADEAGLADCVAAASLIADITKRIEAAHKDAKAPALAVCQELDALKRGFNGALEIEKKRLDALSTAYVTARDAEARKQREAAEREIAAKTAAAVESGASTDELRELAMARRQLAAPEKVDGARTTQTWDYEVLNLPLLAEARPDLVKIEPRRREILAAIAGGVNIAGLRVFAETKVRASA